VDGIGQLYEPSFGVLDTITLFQTPAFRSSIFTYAPGMPTEVQLIVLVVPFCQFSPPLGDVTVIPGVLIVYIAVVIMLC
jgi:hypothetical protein